MSFSIISEALDLLDDPQANGARTAGFLKKYGAENITLQTCRGEKGSTDFIRVLIPGKNGKSAGGKAPTLGVVGRLGGIGARPDRLGFTSDGDGALSALAIAAKLSRMHSLGDILEGDVIVTNHICPDAPTRPHDPVPFMESPVTSAECNAHEVDPAMDAVISIDTTKGNRIVNHRGIAITPTVRDGWILRVSEDFLSILEITTGKLPVVLPLTQQDITPYGNGIYHLNSILQPSVVTRAPVIGLAITAVSQVPGCATGATHLEDISDAVSFTLEAAKAYVSGKAEFCDDAEFARLQSLYGAMSHLRTFGKEK